MSWKRHKAFKEYQVKAWDKILHINQPLKFMTPTSRCVVGSAGIRFGGSDCEGVLRQEFSPSEIGPGLDGGSSRSGVAAGVVDAADGGSSVLASGNKN